MKINTQTKAVEQVAVARAIKLEDDERNPSDWNISPLGEDKICAIHSRTQKKIECGSSEFGSFFKD